jgi:hypothetical protein
MTKINYHSVKEFGDHDTVGYMEDGRVFWTWNMGHGAEPEKLLEMGENDGENGGKIFPSIPELIEYLESGGREDLAEAVRKNFD